MTTEFEKINLLDQMTEDASNYAQEVILTRAIPDVRDGLKPGQRRVIHAMNELKLAPNKPHVKSARVVGDTMGKYHPKGDAGIYEALVRMTQPWKLNLPLVDKHGNFGSIQGFGAGAQRYTEARMSKYSELLTADLNKDAVDFIPNYDGSEMEPRILPASFPNALANGVEGISWSLSTSIAPHNVLELLDGAIKLAEDEDVSPAEMAKIIKGPDFPTGCHVVVDPKELEKELISGEGKYIMRADVTVKATPKKPKVIVKSLPHLVDYNDNFKNKLVDVLIEAKTFNIVEIINNSTDSEVHFELVAKDGTSEEKLNQLVNYLYKKTRLEASFSVNNTMIHKGKPTKFGVIRYLKVFNEFRLETLRRIWNHDNKKLKKRIEVIEGLLRLKDITEDVIKLARNCDSKKDLVETLIATYKFTERQADNIASLQIYQLGKQNFEALANELADLTKKSADFELWLTNDDEATEKLIEDLEATKAKLKDHKRRSKILKPSDIKNDVVIKLEDLVETKKTKVVIKRDLEIFQLGRVAYNNQIEKYKDDDIVMAFDALTTDYITAVTSDGTTVTRFVNDLPESNLTGKTPKLNQEIPDLKANLTFVGGLLNHKEDKAGKFFILTAEGAVKVGEAEKLLPNVNNKGYMKRLGKGAKLKTDTDTVVYAGQFTDKEFDTLEVQVTLKDSSRKAGQVVRKKELSKFKDRTDTAGSSGTKGFNTGKPSGSLPFVSVAFVPISTETEN